MKHDSSDAKKKWDLHRAIKSLMPFLSIAEVTAYCDNLTKYGESLDLLLNSVRAATARVKNEDYLLEHLKQMHENGFIVQQMLTLANAPEVTTSGAKPREDLLRGWNSEKGFKQEHDTLEIAARTVMVGGALFTLAGLPVVFLSAAYGAYKTNPDAVETSKILADYSFGLGRDLYQALFTESVTNKLDMAYNTALMAVGFVGLKDLLKKTNDINLSSKLYSRFSNDSDQKTRDHVVNSLNQIPKNWQHLLTHLTADELVVFSKSDDPDRKILLSKNPPSLEQRYLSALSSNANVIRNWQARLQVAATPFEADIPPFMKGQTIKSALLGMRKNETQKSAHDQKPNLG